MSRTRKLFGYPHLLLAGALALGVWAALPADDALLGRQQGVLLLRNGELVAGEIQLAGDRYDVNVGNGQIHIKRSEVEYVGATEFDCFERRRQRVEPGKVQDQLELAEWCLRNKLYEQAGRALADAVTADASHPRIALLERRLKFAVEKPAERAPSTSTAKDGPSTHDLDRMVGGLPPGCVETFTTVIQPLLLNHCSTAGCHGPTSATSLKLLRIPAGRTPSRRATQRNLYAVLSAVDQTHPDLSSLLTIPTRAHGTAKSAIFTTREANQYKQLLRWVYEVANQPVPDFAAGEPLATSAPRSVRKARAGKRTPHVVTEAPQEARAATKKPLAQHLPGGEVPSIEDQDDGADPFDPDVFNQRYHAASDPE